MLILVFDTETSGLPLNINNSELDSEKWPYILQLAYILYDTNENKIIDKFDSLIKIDININIHPKSIEIHQITQDKLQLNGININLVLNKFNNVLKLADRIVGHNLIFDKKMILVESKRNNISINFIKDKIHISQYCTMLNTVNICKIQKLNSKNKIFYKYPKLNELILLLFNEECINLHNALIDVVYTLRAYCKIIDNIDIFDNIDILNLREYKSLKV